MSADNRTLDPVEVSPRKYATSYEVCRAWGAMSQGWGGAPGAADSCSTSAVKILQGCPGLEVHRAEHTYAVPMSTLKLNGSISACLRKSLTTKLSETSEPYICTDSSMDAKNMKRTSICNLLHDEESTPKKRAIDTKGRVKSAEKGRKILKWMDGPVRGCFVNMQTKWREYGDKFCSCVTCQKIKKRYEMDKNDKNYKLLVELSSSKCKAHRIYNEIIKYEGCTSRPSRDVINVVSIMNAYRCMEHYDNRIDRSDAHKLRRNADMLTVKSNIDFYDFQKMAIESILTDIVQHNGQQRGGYVVLPCASGKSMIMLGAFFALGIPFAVVTKTEILISNIVIELFKHFNISEGVATKIGFIGIDTKKVTKPFEDPEGDGQRVTEEYEEEKKIREKNRELIEKVSRNTVYENNKVLFVNAHRFATNMMRTRCGEDSDYMLSNVMGKYPIIVVDEAHQLNDGNSNMQKCISSLKTENASVYGFTQSRGYDGNYANAIGRFIGGKIPTVHEELFENVSKVNLRLEFINIPNTSSKINEIANIYEIAKLRHHRNARNQDYYMENLSWILNTERLKMALLILREAVRKEKTSIVFFDSLEALDVFEYITHTYSGLHRERFIRITGDDAIIYKNGKKTQTTKESIREIVKDGTFVILASNVVSTGWNVPKISVVLFPHIATNQTQTVVQKIGRALRTVDDKENNHNEKTGATVYIMYTDHVYDVDVGEYVPIPFQNSGAEAQRHKRKMPLCIGPDSSAQSECQFLLSIISDLVGAYDSTAVKRNMLNVMLLKQRSGKRVEANPDDVMQEMEGFDIERDGESKRDEIMQDVLRVKDTTELYKLMLYASEHLFTLDTYNDDIHIFDAYANIAIKTLDIKGENEMKIKLMTIHSEYNIHPTGAPAMKEDDLSVIDWNRVVVEKRPDSYWKDRSVPQRIDWKKTLGSMQYDTQDSWEIPDDLLNREYIKAVVIKRLKPKSDDNNDTAGYT